MEHLLEKYGDGILAFLGVVSIITIFSFLFFDENGRIHQIILNYINGLCG